VNLRKLSSSFWICGTVEFVRRKSFLVCESVLKLCAYNQRACPSGPKKQALELIRRKIESQTAVVQAARRKFDAAKQVGEVCIAT